MNQEHPYYDRSTHESNTTDDEIMDSIGRRNHTDNVKTNKYCRRSSLICELSKVALGGVEEGWIVSGGRLLLLKLIYD